MHIDQNDQPTDTEHGTEVHIFRWQMEKSMTAMFHLRVLTLSGVMRTFIARGCVIPFAETSRFNRKCFKFCINQHACQDVKKWLLDSLVFENLLSSDLLRRRSDAALLSDCSLPILISPICEKVLLILNGSVDYSFLVETSHCTSMETSFDETRLILACPKMN